MFTKPPHHGPSGLGFTNETTKLRAEWLNYVGDSFPSALDVLDGGYHQYVGDIELSSDTAQIKINAPAALQPIELRGFITIGLSDDVNYATGTGTLTVAIPATFTAGVTMSGALTFSNTVQFNGAVTVNAATTFTSNGDVTLQSGCAVTGASGSSLTMQSGATTTLASTNTFSGTTTISGTTTLSGTTTISGSVSLTNRRVIRRARVTATDADQSVNVGQGDRFELPAINAAPRIITLTSTGTVPNEGECLEFIWSPAGAGGGGTQYTFQREDTTVVATFVGSTAADTGTVCAEFEFTGGVWRLGYSSGTPYDGVDSYGVVPGTGA
jgi:hypothetical protein